MTQIDDTNYVKIPYGNGEVKLDIPRERVLGILNPRSIAGVKDPHSTVLEALRNPVDGKGLKSAVKKGCSVVIITDDYTRPTPSGQICEAIMDELNSLEVQDSCISILVGGGLHRPMTKDELRAKFGVALIERAKIVLHDAWNDEQVEYIGTTSMGTPLWVNRLLVRADSQNSSWNDHCSSPVRLRWQGLKQSYLEQADTVRSSITMA